MKEIKLLHKKRSQVGEIPTPSLFFPRIIREFDDGPDEKPMIYGDD